MASLPLVRGFGAGAAFAYREGKRIGIEQFLGDAANLAASLPDRPYLLNLCGGGRRGNLGPPRCRIALTFSICASTATDSPSVLPPPCCAARPTFCLPTRPLISSAGWLRNIRGCIA
jgi:hypothetical protein